MSNQPPGVAVDAAHCELIAGLVRAQKPESILEFGFGEGATQKAMLDAVIKNGNEFHYSIVENGGDWGGRMPLMPINLLPVQVFKQNEEAFVFSTADTFDFIMSDADHLHTHEWFEKVYVDILNPGGILVYHDASNPDFPGLCGIKKALECYDIPHVLFNKSSQPHERCERGLLVLFKPK